MSERKTESITAELINTDSRFSGYYIVVDFKEKEISEIAKTDDSKFTYPVIISDLFRGDIAIYYKDKLLILIERKTWADLSSSFRDGRIHNIRKMIDARTKTGCRLFYFIEGKKPRPNSRINTKALQSHLDHCIFRDDIHVVYTDSITGTINRVNTLTRNYSTLVIKEKTGSSETKESKNPDEELDKNIDHVDHIELLQKKEKKPETEIIQNIYTAVPGISEKTFGLMKTNRIHLKRLFRGKISAEYLAGLQYESGVSVGLIRAKKIVDPFVNPGKKHIKVYQKILVQIPGIGKSTAEVILKNFEFSKLVKIKDSGLISAVKTSNRTIGNSKAQSLLTYLNFKFDKE